MAIAIDRLGPMNSIHGLTTAPYLANGSESLRLLRMKLSMSTGGFIMKAVWEAPTFGTSITGLRESCC